MSEPCISADELTGLKINCQPVTICCSEPEIEAAIDRAIEIANIFTGHNWCPYEACILFSGNGRKRLFLNEQTSIYLNSVETVTAIDGTRETAIEVTNNNHWLESEDCFPCGRNNIEVCGTWGKPMPDYLKHGIILLALEMLQPGSGGIQNPGGVTRADWEDFSISYRVDETYNELRPTTGYREIDNVFMNFLNPVNEIGFTVVPSDESCFNRSCGIVVKDCCSKRSCQCRS